MLNRNTLFKVAVALALCSGLASHAGTAPSYSLKLEPLPSFNVDYIRVSADGSIHSAAHIYNAGFYSSDSNSSGLVAGTVGGGLGSQNVAAVLDSATGQVRYVAGSPSGAYDINEAGEVLFGYQDPRFGNTTSELLVLGTGGAVTSLGVTSYRRPSFNNQHELVGEPLYSRSFYFKDGHSYDLLSLVVDAKGLTELHAQDINDAGLIAGYGTFGGFSGYSAFVLTPITAVPEPQTYALVLAGLGLIAGVARCRSKQR